MFKSTAVLIIHEITAILPLFGFMALFVYMDWVPTAWVAGPWAGWALEGVRKYAGYFRKKGWFGMAHSEEGERKLEGELEEEIQRENKEGKKSQSWFGSRKSEPTSSESSVEAAEVEEAGKKSTTAWQKVKKVVTFDNVETGYKTSIQFAAAYAITKLLLPARLALSIWLTPSGARIFSRIMGFARGATGR